MITNITLFDTVEEIEKLTGLCSDELWEKHFNLDDMDWGFCVDGDDWFIREEHHWAQEIRRKYEECGKHLELLDDFEGPFMKHLLEDPNYDVEYSWHLDEEKEIPFSLTFILDRMESYCVGYSVAVYNGKTYVTLHHA